MSTIRAFFTRPPRRCLRSGIVGVIIVALLLAFGVSAQARSDSSQQTDASRASDYSAGRDFIKAAVFGIGPMTGEVSDAVADPDFDKFLETRIDTHASNAHLNDFLRTYDRAHRGLIAKVGVASRAGDPYQLDRAVTAFLDNVSSVTESVAASKNGVSPESAHARAVVPLAVAAAAYMYVLAAHTAVGAIQVAGGFAYFVFNKVKFWRGGTPSEASQLQHEVHMLRLAEGLAN